MYTYMYTIYYCAEKSRYTFGTRTKRNILEKFIFDRMSRDHPLWKIGEVIRSISFK